MTLLSLGAALAALSPGRADAEPLILSLDFGAQWPLTEPQSRVFGPGATGSIVGRYPIVPALLAGLRLRGGIFQDGTRPAERGIADPDGAMYFSALVDVRVRPMATGDGPRNVGLYFDGSAGVALTGELSRATFEGGVGWNFEVGPVELGPALRYIHVMQPDENLDPNDARIIVFGMEASFLDARTPPPPPMRAPPPDTDLDGFVDPEDDCPTDPEDRDQFEDDDGCPDVDNDADGILDVTDQCPSDPEDKDEFEDEDGCPDLDNDADQILDPVDQCPNEPEVVNGVDDQDGCPDQGLIEMVDDRIILEETVLFDFERARVKSAARPVIDAIVALIRQHPEWVRVRIEGHADARGDAEYNLDLSRRRALNVVRALVEAGATQGLFVAEGFGSRRPRDVGEGETAHQRNRRVEFVVIARRSATGDVVSREPDAPPVTESVDDTSDGGAAELPSSDMTFTTDDVPSAGGGR